MAGHEGSAFVEKVVGSIPTFHSKHSELPLSPFAS